MKEVELHLTDDASRRLWSSVANLAALLPTDWVLIGGLMVQLHAQEASVAYELGRAIANESNWPGWYPGNEYGAVRATSEAERGPKR